MYAPTSIRKVWILTFEFSGIVKVGGLGEVVSLLSYELARRGLDVTVIMPSHGVRPQGFRELAISCRGTRYGVDGCGYEYDLGFLEGVFNGIRIILVTGRSPQTSMVLDVWPPYSYANEKACLLARAVRCLAQNYWYPDIVHANDWHSALAAAMLKIEAELQGYALPVLYQIHLRASPSYPWHYASESWCGLPNVAHRIWVVHKHVFEYTQSIWDSCWGNIECFIVRLADAVASVSRSEIEGLAKDYGEWVKLKSCYSYNSTLWCVDEVRRYTLNRYGSDKRHEIRWDVVKDVMKIVTYAKVWGYLDLSECKVLVVSSGRLTPQKGFDILINAAKYLPPSIKILILGRRVGDENYESYLRYLLSEVVGKAIVVFDDVNTDMYKSLIYVAHVYAIPSRYEPFGITGIEALALGTPLVVSDVGGLSEYVGDIRVTPIGVGLRIPPTNIIEYAKAIQSLGYLMYYSETGQDIDMIVFRELKDIALREPKYGEKLRELAITYVDAYFRPRHTTNSITVCYELARKMAYYRAHT